MTKVNVRRDRTWVFNFLRADDDADWPDERPVPYGRVDRKYRPVRVQMSFHQRNDEAVDRPGCTIYGPRIIKSGPDGAVVDEPLWHEQPDEPWFNRLMDFARFTVEEEQS